MKLRNSLLTENFARIIPVVIIVLMVISMEMGCASQTRTTKTETSVIYPESQAVTGESVGQKTIVEKETTTSTTQTGEESAGVLSTTVNVIGEIIALPFRLVGGLFRLVF